jgi:tetratricopeptide (TPR) repeat protein
MGEVYLARDVSTGLECALKKLALSGTGTPEGLKREFEAMTRVRHPAVVSVHELGFAPDGTTFITMEYVPGAPADRAIAIGDWDSVCFAATQLVVGLEAIHAAGVLHGDLKPSNVLVVASASGRRPASVRVVDFGLAALDQDARGRGTPGFAAPEVVRGEPLSVSSDLYSLGTTLYALCVGRSPFESRSFEGTLERQRVAPPSSAALEEAGTPRAHRAGAAPHGERAGRAAARRARGAPRAGGDEPGGAPPARRAPGRRHGRRTRARAGASRAACCARRSHRAPLWLDGAGIGKTALLGEMAARAARAGGPSCASRAPGVADPLAPARTPLVRLAAEAGSDLDTETLTSGARAFLRGETEPAGVDATSLSDAAARWIRASGEKGLPLLVLVDDGEQLSPEARGLLVRVLLHPDAEGLVSIWAFADDEGRLNADARALVDAGIAERVTVTPLTRDGLWRARRRAALRAASRRARGVLVGAHRGHPARPCGCCTRRRGGRDSRGRDRIAVDAAALAKLDTSGTYESELLRRLERAPAATRAAAHALAAFGRSASQDELSDVDAAANAGAVDELVRLGIATRDDDGGARLQPSSIADTVLATLNEDCRRRLHERILARPGLSAVERFRHRRMSGDHAGALDAADEAFTARADARLAAAAAEVAGAHAPERAADWLQRSAVALFAAGRYADAVAPLERSLSMDGTPGARAARWPLLATAYLRIGRPNDVERVVQRALEESQPPAIRSRLKVNDAARLVAQGAREEALVRAREALDEAEVAGDAEVLGDALLTLGGALHISGRSEETVSIARRASEVYAGVSTRHRLRAETQAAIALLAIGRADEAEQRYRDALDVARREGLRLANEELALSLGSALVEAGRWSEAREAVEEGARIALEDGRPNGVAVAFTHLAQLDGLMGRPRLAYRRARAALRLTRAHLPQSPRRGVRWPGES